MSRALTLAGVSIVVLALVLGMAVPALAAPDSAPPRVCDSESELLRGEVISIGDQEFVIQSGEEEISIAVDEETRYCQMSVPGALVRQRLELHLQSQLELRARIGNGQGLQNRVRAVVSACNRLRLRTQVALAEGTPLPKICCLRGLCPFGEQAEFADIAVGDSVAVLAEDNLAQVVLITKPAD
jgi:hypothetical protein